MDGSDLDGARREALLLRQLDSVRTKLDIRDGHIDALKAELAAANERAGRLEKALAFYADPLKHNLMGEVNEDHGAIARKALEVPDAL